MKAKDQAKRYKANETQETLAEILADFVVECGEIAEARHAKRPEAVAAVFDEQERKWYAFAELVNVEPDLFKLAVVEIMPKAYLAWQYYRTKFRK